MTSLSTQQLEECAGYYEDLLVPALFSKWAKRLAKAARIDAGDRVLDVACGTGVLAREAAKRAGPAGSVRGLDSNPGMLAQAKKLAPEIVWQQGSAESLPYGDESFDVVVSQFGLTFFSDAKGALREMYRVLAPGGRVVVAVFDSIDSIPPYRTMAKILDRRIGEGAGDALRAPFALGDQGQFTALLRAAELDCDVSTKVETARFPSLKSMVLADAKGWYPLAGIVLDEDDVDGIVSEAEQELRDYLNSDGEVKFPLPAHVAFARAGRAS